MSTGASCEGSYASHSLKGPIVNKQRYFYQKRNTEEEANYLESEVDEFG